MPRISTVIHQLIEDKQQELAQDKLQLAALKRQAIAGGGATPEFLQKPINALRTTIANGTEDLDDLQIEFSEAQAFEASEAGQLRRCDTQNKLKAVDALADVCMTTAQIADEALLKAWAALRRHHAAHSALNDAVSGAYAAVTEGSGFDTSHYDQLFLVRGYSSIRNGMPALAQFVVEALKGYELEEFIQVKGVTLNHNQHDTLYKAEGVMLGRMWQRMKEIAQRCGHEVHEDTDLALDPLRSALLDAVMQAEIK